MTWSPTPRQRLREVLHVDPGRRRGHRRQRVRSAGWPPIPRRATSPARTSCGGWAATSGRTRKASRVTGPAKRAAPPAWYAWRMEALEVAPAAGPVRGTVTVPTFEEPDQSRAGGGGADDRPVDDARQRSATTPNGPRLGIVIEADAHRIAVAGGMQPPTGRALLRHHGALPDRGRRRRTERLPLRRRAAHARAAHGRPAGGAGRRRRALPLHLRGHLPFEIHAAACPPGASR